MCRKFALVVAVFFLVTGAHAATRSRAAWRQYVKASDAGFDAVRLEEVRKFADESKSAAVLVVQDETVVAAWGAVDRKLELHSVRKSLYAALWGIADSRGLVDVNATLADLGVDDLGGLTDVEKSARIVDLLHARSGVYHPSAYAPQSMEAELPARGSHAPDTFWYYNNWDFNVAGALLERATGKSMGVLFDDWIAQPLGMEDYEPSDVFAVREPHTSTWPALTFRMSARDLARFGAMWLADGRWNGKQIVPAKWVRRASTSASNTGDKGDGYGMMWWTYERGALDAQRYPEVSKVRVVMAKGTGGQVLAIIPDAHLVIVHRADTDNGRRVAGPDIWKIIDRLLDARRSPAKHHASTVAMRTAPFSSEVPALKWPAAMALDEKAMTLLAGSYELRPGAVAQVYIDGAHLFGSLPGQGEAELFAITPSEFFVRVDPSVRIRFDLDEAGRAKSMSASIGGRTLTAQRKE
jgi:CubicO group peptidase (beta-lactamase class C family)